MDPSTDTPQVSQGPDWLHPLHAQARTLLRRFQRHRDMILRFTVNLDVSFTNNTAEVRHEVARDEWTRRGEGQQMMLVA